MSGALILTLVLAAVVGLALGTLGGGGSILTVPLLTYVAGMPAREAIAASLLVVGVTSLSSLIVHTRHKRVRWRTGLIFGAAGMGGAFLGGLLGGRLPATVLMVAFALMMIATAAAMITKKARGKAGRPATEATHNLPVLRTILDRRRVRHRHRRSRRRIPHRPGTGAAGRSEHARRRRHLPTGDRHEVLRRPGRLPDHRDP